MAESVTLSAVSKRYRTRLAEVPVLDGIDLEVRPGEFIAVLGPSGCGKSTLLRLIGGLDGPSEGAVKLGGREVTRTDPRCAVVFQESRLFPWKSTTDNIAFGARRAVDPLPTDLILSMVGLQAFANAYPHQLSGGMAQRAALARALIGRPEVLLMDEPFASLDAFTRMQMQDLVVDTCRAFAPTVVLVTHDVDEALYLADRVIVMSPRPATIMETLSVSLPHPRDRAAAELASMRARVLSLFGFSHSTPGYEVNGEERGAGANAEAMEYAYE
jgi:ABC-type nitrate/sulfonate/bicarbonate transport system ATPase subunit